MMKKSKARDHEGSEYQFYFIHCPLCGWRDPIDLKPNPDYCDVCGCDDTSIGSVIFDDIEHYSFQVYHFSKDWVENTVKHFEGRVTREHLEAKIKEFEAWVALVDL